LSGTFSSLQQAASAFKERVEESRLVTYSNQEPMRDKRRQCSHDNEAAARLPSTANINPKIYTVIITDNQTRWKYKSVKI